MAPVHCAEYATNTKTTDYLERQNKAAAYIHWKTCQHYNIESPKRWYEHKPETVTEKDEVTILCGYADTYG